LYPYFNKVSTLFGEFNCPVNENLAAGTNEKPFLGTAIAINNNHLPRTVADGDRNVHVGLNWIFTFESLIAVIAALIYYSTETQYFYQE
jgi:hypothetical protein